MRWPKRTLRRSDKLGGCLTASKGEKHALIATGSCFCYFPVCHEASCLIFYGGRHSGGARQRCTVDSPGRCLCLPWECGVDTHITPPRPHHLTNASGRHSCHSASLQFGSCGPQTSDMFPTMEMLMAVGHACFSKIEVSELVFDLRCQRVHWDMRCVLQVTWEMLCGTHVSQGPASRCSQHTHTWNGSEIPFTDCDNGRLDAVKRAAYSVSSGRLGCSMPLCVSAMFLCAATLILVMCLMCLVMCFSF